MFFYFPAFFYALIFSAGLELIIRQPELIFYILAALVLFSLWSAMKIGKRWLFAITPLVFSVSSATLLYFIDLPTGKHAFVFFSTLMYYLSLLSAYRLRYYIGDQTARGLFMAVAIAAIFLFYSASYGFYLNFFVPLWMLMLAYFLTAFLISYQYFQIIERKRIKLILIYSVLLGLAMAEIAWIISFWPFGYLTTGVIALIFYYVLWDLAQSYFLNILSKKRVIANIILFSFLITIILASSKWLPNI